MKNVIKKPNTVLSNVTSKIQTKSIWLMVYALNNCFCRKKAKINFTQSNFNKTGLITAAYHQYLVWLSQLNPISVLGYFIQCTQNQGRYKKVSKNLRKYEKVWYELRYWAKSWERIRKCANSWENMLKVEKVCQNLKKYEKEHQNLRKYKKVCQNLWKYGNVWESVLKVEKAWKVC